MTADPIRCLGIVNRGEAAMRCVRAVKSLRALEGGALRALALYTEVDREAPFVRHADIAVALPMRGSAVRAYLDHDLLIQALQEGGADAVWPGWGFVAEDPIFAERVVAAGMRFLGPSGATMRRLGDKIAAKLLAQHVGVPVPPWSGGEVANASAALQHAGTLGYPLVIKASAGGGGRGIRMVETPDELAEAFRAAASEATAAFGDGRVFLERRVVGGRHIEVQIGGDQHGRIIALGCRDCSVQRRHQKVIEEAPPPGVPRERLRELEEAAVALASAVGYCGVGTVEFLVTPSEFYFLEINPRLQVEHGITEAITGIDLVQLQIRLARGEALPDYDGRSRGVAIEARVCAEDPDAGFQPAPGRVARFDPPLGPGVRVDSGVVAGSVVPPDFDSLIAKVIATGDTREEAVARLACALSDFELVIAGGATNKGYLLELLAAPEYRAAAIDTAWLDRWSAGRMQRAALDDDDYGVEALIVAAVVVYQQARYAVRLNFYTDSANVSPTRVPPSLGQQIDLAHRGEQYRVHVFATGSWRYRIHLDGRVGSVTVREDGPHAARLRLGGRMLRVLYDVTDASLRVEIEGRPHRFGRQSAGHVCAGTPAVVIALHVKPGDRVAAGQSLGLLEAMKMEVSFVAPVAGVVTELRVLRGQQVAAGDVLLVIDSASTASVETPNGQRLRVPEQPDPLALFFPTGSAAPDLGAAERADPVVRRVAIDAVREEIRRVLLGYDADAERGVLLAAFLEAPLPAELSETFRRELAEIRHELTLFADIEQLFLRTPRVSATGTLRPSNSARLAMYVRRMRASGAGIAEGFLALVEKALRHYGVPDLAPRASLERAVLRLFASQRAPELRHRLVMGVVQRVVALARAGLYVGDARPLVKALSRIARLRGLVPDALADGATEAGYVIFEGPELERQAARAIARIDDWLATADATPAPPPESVLRQLANAPRPVFERVRRWLDHADPRRRAVALAAHLRWLYAPNVPSAHICTEADGVRVDRVEFPDGQVVVGGVSATGDLVNTAQRLCEAARAQRRTVHAIELLAPADDRNRAALADVAAYLAANELNAGRFTVTLLPAASGGVHTTFVPATGGVRERHDLHGLHPETASRIDLDRLAAFELERIESAEGVYSFYGRSRAVPRDERVFVLADVRERAADEPEAVLHIAAFERAFYAATRTLRTTLGVRDQRRHLQWNRIALFVAPEIFLDRMMAERLARRLAPAIRHLGLEKVVARVHLFDRQAPRRAARPVEIVIADPTGSRMEITWREPHHEPLRPATDYERKVVDARRRGLVYPYEIIRLLTGGTRGNGASANDSAEFPSGAFEEFDLDETAASPTVVGVAGRPYGLNPSSVVVGVITTPTDTVPEGMRRVLILSDPTVGMGSLAAPECDRIVAAIDLAERLGVPVEWVPVSSGARIAMESGTENLDATARVVRRIVTFTDAGGVIHVIVHGVNVGAQSYFDALSTMLTHTRGVLIMTPGGSMVLTGRAALEASGAVAAEDEVAIGGFERVMGPNGEAQYYAHNLVEAYRILYDHYRYTYVVPGEVAPRARVTTDSPARSICTAPYDAEEGHDFATVGEIFDDQCNPDRKRPFAMRAVMRAVIDDDGGHLERWRAMVGAETAIVWDAYLGGHPVCVIGIESQNVPREGFRPLDGPSTWNGGTLFPLSAKKVARALNAASGNRPAVILANLSGFDGSPESMRKLQLEYGADIARAVVNFAGPLLFAVVSRYHGGAYVVFSRALNDDLRAAALAGSYASVIGGGPAAAVVFPREVRARAVADPRMVAVRRSRIQHEDGEHHADIERTLAEIIIEKQAEVAAEFDAIHTVERARAVGSLEAIIPASELRPYLIQGLVRASEQRTGAEDTIR
ncbi:MAG: ATP-grasp domain-containing protein [Deltaproteobacteria bacterium]|nr:ATP-grasp domain-containing protein [Deltaproteobacteria bacterium]